MKKLIFPIIALFFIIILSSKIDTYSQNFLIQKPSDELSNQIFYKTFGEFREYLSDLSYLQADAYFHGQGQRCKEENCTENHIETPEEHKAEHAPKEEHPVFTKSLNPLLNISQTMLINKHRHLSGNEQKEMLPWFYFAVKLNPHNEQAYCIGGFWLATRLNKIDEAIKLLEAGIKNNPDSWEIYSTLGEIYIIQKKDYPKAAYNFEHAKILGDQQSADKFKKKIIYTFLGEAYKKLGKTEQAQVLEKELDKLFSTDKPADNH
ncbi:MAG: hypothetical protein KJ915_06665 [Candidatus Omnitrophica bacterium]|nr:hypothetical protein [Candidatus Omnitrophota bacterium]